MMAFLALFEGLWSLFCPFGGGPGRLLRRPKPWTLDRVTSQTVLADIVAQYAIILCAWHAKLKSCRDLDSGFRVVIRLRSYGPSASSDATGCYLSDDVDFLWILIMQVSGLRAYYRTSRPQNRTLKELDLDARAHHASEWIGAVHQSP